MQTKLWNTGAWLRSVNLKQTCLGALFAESPKQALIQRKDALNNLVVKVSRWKRNKCLGNVVSGDISKSRKCAPKVENKIAMQIFHCKITLPSHVEIWSTCTMSFLFSLGDKNNNIDWRNKKGLISLVSTTKQKGRRETAGSCVPYCDFSLLCGSNFVLSSCYQFNTEISDKTWKWKILRY